MLKSFELEVVNVLISKGIVPKIGLFQIEEYQLQSYLTEYHNLNGRSNRNTGTNSNKRFARRLAGLTLLKLLFSRGAKYNQVDAGIVYLIENKAFPEHYKVGMTIELEDRLSKYQTYSPYRDYMVYKYEFVLNRSSVEKYFLSHPGIIKETGEWIRKENAKELFEKIVFNC